MVLLSLLHGVQALKYLFFSLSLCEYKFHTNSARKRKEGLAPSLLTAACVLSLDSITWLSLKTCINTIINGNKNRFTFLLNSY